MELLVKSSLEWFIFAYPEKTQKKRSAENGTGTIFYNDTEPLRVLVELCSLHFFLAMFRPPNF